MQLKNPTFKLTADNGYQSIDGKGRPLFNTSRKRRIKCNITAKIEMRRVNQ